VSGKAGSGLFAALPLFELWRLGNPAIDEDEENAAGKREAVPAMDAGRMRPFSAFDSESCQRHGLWKHPTLLNGDGPRP